MKKLFFLSLFSILFLAVSCPQQNPTPKPTPPEVLPPATQTGANTFGCLINGNVWLPGGSDVPAIVPTYDKNQFAISAQKNTYQQMLYIIAKPVYDTGKYYLKNENFYLGIGYQNQINKCTYTFNDNDSLQNWVHITKLDQINFIVSGTFNMYFATSGCDTLRITEGRFDAKYSN